jgi:hypothetical protein
MPEIKKVYKKLYGVDITEDIKAKSHPTQKCLIELANKVPAGSKKVGLLVLVKKSYAARYFVYSIF